MAEVIADGAENQGEEEDAWATDEEEEEEEEPDEPPQIPSYPFPAEFDLEVMETRVGVIRHLCKQHPRGTRAIVCFFPGVHGGVGPCRLPGANFDENALYASVVKRLDGEGVAADCYRCSWPVMRPNHQDAIASVCRVVHHAMDTVMQDWPEAAGLKDIRLLIVGHSMGGAIAVQAADIIARHFGEDGRGGSYSGSGLEDACVHVAGVCTLNGALNIDNMRFPEGCVPFEALSPTRALIVYGEEDQVVPPAASVSLFEAYPGKDKQILSLPGGTHDLYGHKEQLIEELSRFVTESVQLAPVPPQQRP